MDQIEKKAAVAAYRERKPARGVFAVICSATGEVWVDQSRNLDSQHNRLWFSLRHGNSFYKSLRSAWTAHGEDEFRFEELERLRDDYPEIGIGDELKRRTALWKQRLQAASLAS